MVAIIQMSTYKYHPYIDDYINAIRTGEIIACKEQHQLVDLVEWKLEQPGVVIDAEAIEKSVNTPAPFFHFKLLKWQRFVNACMFGLRNADGSLQFDQILLYMGRGNGKNSTITYNSQYMTSSAHGIKNYNISIVATSEDSAKTSFSEFYDIINDKDIGEKTHNILKNSYHCTKTLIQHKGTNSKFEFKTSNAKTKDGQRPGCVIFDKFFVA